MVTVLPIGISGGLDVESLSKVVAVLARIGQVFISMRILLIALGILTTVYLGICIALFAFQRSMIYFPQRGSGGGGGILEVDGAKLVITQRVVEGGDAVVYFGGNAEDVSYSLPVLLHAYPERSLYLMNYRGYGGSSGSPSEQALFGDGLALYDMVALRHANVTVIGRSLGGGVALYLASLRPVERLVLVTPFDSVEAVAAEQFRWFPVRWLLNDKFESWKYAQKVKAPTFVIAAEKDEVIGMARTRKLCESFVVGVASMRVVARAGHNDISNYSEYMVWLRGWSD